MHSDKIVFGGLKDTLREKTSNGCYEVELNGWKSKYVAFLSRNIIIDFSNADQLKLIGIKLNQLSSRFQSSIERLERYITKLHNCIRKIENLVTGEAFLNNTESYNYTDSNESGSKMIYVTLTLHSMDQIVNKPVTFHGSSQEQFSEMSFLVKFQGPVFELFFFNANEYCIQWGDTISSHLSVINLHFKLDFRLIAKNFNNDKFDVTTGELARHSSTTSSKMNGDFIKSSLTTIVHLNAPLKRMSYIPPK